MKFNIVIVRPLGYQFALSFLDPAIQVWRALVAAGFEARVLVNRFSKDAVNIVIGAHLLESHEFLSSYRYVVFNLEQLGRAQLSEQYIDLLSNCPLLDYSEDNLRFLGRTESGAIIRLGYVEEIYNAAEKSESKVADFCFFGSLSDGRKSILDAIELTDLKVMLFDLPLFGPERDKFLSGCRFVLNIPFYGDGPLEDVRIAHCLSLGFPVVSVGSGQSHLSKFVLHFSSVEELVSSEGRSRLAEWERNWPLLLKEFQFHPPVISGLDGIVQEFSFESYSSEMEEYSRVDAAVPPTRMNLGSGRNYLPGWLNVDVSTAACPDVVYDFSKNSVGSGLTLNSYIDGREIFVAPETFDLIYADNVLEHVEDLVGLYSNILSLLKVGGIFEIIVPFEKSKGCWQDPTHVRAFNENSFIYLTDWFWYLGWFDFRFDLSGFSYLGSSLSPVKEPSGAEFLSVTLRKVHTSPAEKNIARLNRSDFGFSEIVGS